ncbi:hypothetical protein FHS21_003667 [Phyllobacterium trifolii]|uniref:Uncharacterized protein n=1 Tax=Phyllobacterium trifolii TaxID=300193 RepID=A0A839UEX5_9HYPH|nr:hypothetical protein [Phyllobacterium trifolii]
MFLFSRWEVNGNSHGRLPQEDKPRIRNKLIFSEVDAV